jgi:imidazolonepropionase-like amidohydrolase
MIDGRADVVQNDVAVVVEGERIVAVGSRAQVESRIPAGAQVIDLVKGDPIADISELTRVSFVMRGGTIYKQ